MANELPLEDVGVNETGLGGAGWVGPLGGVMLGGFGFRLHCVRRAVII